MLETVLSPVEPRRPLVGCRGDFASSCLSPQRAGAVSRSASSGLRGSHRFGPTIAAGLRLPRVGGEEDLFLRHAAPSRMPRSNPELLTFLGCETFGIRTPLFE
jgi:hypothetical protein